MRKDSNILIGDRNTPPLIFLHGFLGNKNDWLEISNSFQNDFFCILPDLIGHGKNTFFPKNVYIHYKNFSDQILSILDHLNIEKATLIAYSMGGRIALNTAINYPERVHSLVLESANPGIENEVERQMRLELDQRRAKEIDLKGLDQFVENWYKIPLFKSLQNHPEKLNKIISERKKNDSEWMKKIIQELSPGNQPALWGSLGKINLPTLLISGGLDQKYQKIMGDCESNIKNAVHKNLANAGHNCHLEDPTGFAEIMNKFLDKNH